MITEDLIRQVRTQTQENNTETISDQSVLDALNRGQDFAFDILAKYYADPIVVEGEVLGVDANGDMDIPETAFEDRISAVEHVIGDRHWKLKRIPFSEIYQYRDTGTPTAYCVIGRKVRIVPFNNGDVFKSWYIRDVDSMVKSQGRIVSVSESFDSIVVDSVGTGLDASDDYGKYVNISDSQTGIIKCSLQIQSISGNQIEFKPVPDRTEVINKTITATVAVDVQTDDYISGIDGTCVPYFKKPISNYVIQYAVYEIRRSLGYDVSLEKQMLTKLEEQIERTWAGREVQMRIKNTNSLFNRGRYRYGR